MYVPMENVLMVFRTSASTHLGGWDCHPGKGYTVLYSVELGTPWTVYGTSIAVGFETDITKVVFYYSGIV